MTSGRDKRGTLRDRVLKGAQISFGSSVLDCVVLDMSINGARISLGIPVSVPEILSLRLRDGTAYPAARRWTWGTEIGLEFTGGLEASGDEGSIRRASAALEAVQAADPNCWMQILRAERFFGDEPLHQAAEAAEAAHLRLQAALKPHTSRTSRDGRHPFETGHGAAIHQG